MTGPLRLLSNSPKDRANNLYIQWKTPKNAGKVLVLVEGWEDVFVYESLFLSSSSSVKDCGGCNNAIGISTHLKKLAPKQKIFTIVDSDFRSFYGRNKKRANLSFTDTHDMETFVLFSSECFEIVINSLKCPSVNHQAIVRDLRLISYIRWYNMDAKMKYKDYELNIVQMSQSRITNYDYLINNHFIPTAGSNKQWLKRCFIHFKNKHSHAKDDQLLNGHDYVDRLCYYARLRNHKQLSQDDVLLAIANACNSTWFKTTRLGNDLIEWQNKNKIQVLV